MKRSYDWFLAFVGGILLALMLDFNSRMAEHSTPLFAAWVAHAVGAITSLVLIVVFSKIFIPPKEIKTLNVNSPIWIYIGGIPGALAVVLSAFTINSSLGLSGTLALMIVGQIFFGLWCDIFGLFGSKKRNLVLIDLFVVLFVVVGSGITIFYRT